MGFNQEEKSVIFHGIADLCYSDQYFFGDIIIYYHPWAGNAVQFSTS